MNAPQHFLPFSSAIAVLRARRWMLLGVVALGVAGIFAGFLGSTKGDYFYTALAVHVDLSVLVWFLTIACMFFTLAGQGRGWGVLADAAFYSFALGTLLLVLSAMTGGEAYMSNYIPVIHHPVFFLGLGLIFCGVAGTAANLLAACSARDSVQAFGVVSAAFILFIAFLCFYWSHASLPRHMQGQIYYEYSFWAGGHLLQFVHTQLMMVAWLWLADAAGLKVRLSNKAIIVLYAFGVLAALTAPFIYLAYDPLSDENRNSFTLLMKHANGFAPLVLGGFILYAFLDKALAVLPRLVGEGEGVLPKICLLMSILLFAVGGGLGYRIAGSNLIVPAHYHGSIVSVTVAFMGVCYLLFPAFGFANVLRSKLARLQPVIYGGGMLCWMLGMFLLGAQGVSRKTPGSYDMEGAIIGGLKHGADGLALIGGLLFVFMVARAAWKGEWRKNEVQH